MVGDFSIKCKYRDAILNQIKKEINPSENDLMLMRDWLSKATYDELERTYEEVERLFSIGRREDKMTFVPCEWYYEHILGDNCNNDCNNCFGDKDIRICVNYFHDGLECVLHKKNNK